MVVKERRVIMYYVAIIQNHGASNALFQYATFEEALEKFHSELAYRHESRTQTVCSILDENGQLHKNEVYNASVSNIEPTEGE